MTGFRAGTALQNNIVVHSTLRVKILSRMANSVDPDQTAPSSLIWVYTVCICHFV